MARILAIDDDTKFLDILERFLTKAEHKILKLSNAERAIAEIASFKPDLVILDILMPGITGGLLYNTIRKYYGPNLPIIICSGTKLRVHSPEDPHLEYCPKPVDYNKLNEAIQRLLAEEKEIDTNL